MNKLTKTLFTSIAIIGLYLSSTAHPIDLQTAQSVASKFMGTNNLQLAFTYQTDKNLAAFYVFNTTNGFVIVAADDCETPIIGYSHESRFDPNNIPVQMEDYLQDFVGRIQYGIENHIEADELTEKQWKLVKATGRLTDDKVTQAITPLLIDKWHQGCLYNNLCPAQSGPCDHAEVGCLAVAMGQIMHYWQYPVTGWGTHLYINQGITISADFGNTTYDWDHMPDSLTDNSSETEIEAVATLLYHCGVAVDMKYGANGSFSEALTITDAMARYFNYSRQIHREKKNDYDNEEWMSLLKNNLDLQRPVLYIGFGSGGHAFVCDGYDDNDLFHFNWGWGGTGNGYYAVGNLNPIGYDFNDSNAAILDIIPHYEPCQVIASAIPPTAGIVEGSGEYHIGAYCTLTVTPTEGYDFYYWKKKDGQIVSSSPSFTFNVEDDTLHIEAHFTLHPVSQITANYTPDASNPNSTSVSLSWSSTDTDWILLKQFDINEELGGLTTDGEHIYVTYAEWNNPPFSFGKYTMDGELVEQFDIQHIIRPVCLAYDGTNFYCNCAHSSLKYIHRIDLINKTAIDSTDMTIWFGALTYDPEHDGFWLGRNYQTILYDRQGQRIQASPTTPNEYVNGTAYFTAMDNSPHLLMSLESGVYNYDINNNIILDSPLLSYDGDLNESLGTCTGIYEGKEALFIVVGNTVRIYDVRSNLSQIIGYRLYRANSEGNAVMIADEVSGSSYIDTSWENAIAGMYRFGISSVFANGTESETVWSDFILKTDYGIDENDSDPTAPFVQKVYENGQIVIIKDGKRYNVLGQRLN